MYVFLITANCSSREGKKALLRALLNLDARKLNDCSWLVKSSAHGPHAIGDYLSSLIDEEDLLIAVRVDGVPYFSKSDVDLVRWAAG